MAGKAKAKARSADNKPDEKRGRFTDPTVDAMRKIGNGFRVLDDLEEADQKIVLQWVKSRFLSRLTEIQS